MRAVVGTSVMRVARRPPASPRTAACRRRRRPARRRATRPAPRPAAGRSAAPRRRALVSTPIAVRHASAMPRTGAPPITGLMPTTGAAVVRSASRTPGIARIVPTETTGFDGGTTTTSASAIAASTPGAGVAVARFVCTNRAAGSAARCRTHHSSKWISWPSAVTTCVSTSSSVIGSSVTPGAHRSARRAVTCDSGSPSRSSSVRARWVARSRSPSVNHSQPRPYAARSSLVRRLSSRRPQPWSSCTAPPSVYIRVSRSGQTRTPCSHMSSPVFAMTVMCGASPQRGRAGRG